MLLVDLDPAFYNWAVRSPCPAPPAAPCTRSHIYPLLSAMLLHADILPSSTVFVLSNIVAS